MQVGQPLPIILIFIYNIIKRDYPEEEETENRKFRELIEKKIVILNPLEENACDTLDDYVFEYFDRQRRERWYASLVNEESETEATYLIHTIDINY